MESSNSALDVLCTPIHIGRLKISNRIVMGPMAVCSPTAEGKPSDQTVAFFEARARGGVGLIIVGGSVVTKRALAESPFRPILRLDTDDHAASYRTLTETVHRYGTKIIFEATAGFGRMGKLSRDVPELIAASPINVVISKECARQTNLHLLGGVSTPLPRAATIDEIVAIEDEVAQSARRCVVAGFDGVEIAAHMSYFLASFLTPRTNSRTDIYGGGAENRARILVNIVRKMRALVGPDFPIGLRITCNEHVDGGQDAHGYAEIAKHVEQAGVDYVALADGCYESMNIATAREDGSLLRHGEPQIFKQALGVPIMLQNAHSPHLAAEAIRAGDADMTMLARPFLADPDYARKVFDGNVQGIVQCKRDNHCVQRLIMGFPVRCEVNPRMGREARTPGKLPPIDRLIKSPVERVALKLANSPVTLNLAAKLRSG